MHIKIIRASSTVFAFCVVIIFSIALSLRLFNLDFQPLWLDEIFSYFLVSSGEWPKDFLRENNPPLYFLLLDAWIFIVGSDEWSLRLISAIFGMLFVVATFWTSSILFNKTAALYASLFSAISPIHIYYSQEVRSYVLLTLILMLSYGSLWKAISNNRKYWWCVFFVCATCSIYVHYFALLALLPTVFPVLMGQYRQHCLMPYFLGFMAMGVMVCVWLVPSVLFGAGGGGAHLWINDIWLQTPPYLAIFKSLELLGIGSQQNFIPLFLKQFTTLQFPEYFRWIGIFCLITIAAPIFLSILNRNKKKSCDLQLKSVWLITSLLLPLAILWIISWFSPYYVVGRYDIIVFPAYALCVGLGLSLLHHNQKGGAVLALFLSGIFLYVTASKLYFYFTAPVVNYGPSAKESAKTLVANVKNGDTVVFSGVRMLPIIYELEKYSIYWDGKKNCFGHNNVIQFVCIPMPLDAADLGVVTGEIRYELEQLKSNEEKLNWIIELKGNSGAVWLLESDFRNPNAARNMRSLMLGLSRLGYIQNNSNREMYKSKIWHIQLQI